MLRKLIKLFKKPKRKQPRLEYWTGSYFEINLNMGYIQVVNACRLASVILYNETFEKKVLSVEYFTNTTDSPKEVLNRLRFQKTSYVKFYLESIIKDRLFKTLAVTEINGQVMFLNHRRLERSMSSIVGTLLHERCHQLGYVHSSAKDKNSVPYKIGEIAESMISDAF